MSQTLPPVSRPPTATATTAAFRPLPLSAPPIPRPATAAAAAKPSSLARAFSKTLEKSHVTYSSSSCPRPATAASSSARRDAVAEVQAATDLESTLARLKGILQLQDLNKILRHFGEQRKWHEASQLFDWMQKHEKLNFASYSSFFKYMGISRNYMRALQVYDSILDESVKINASICNSILGCLVRNGRFDCSIQLFDKMKDNGLSPDLVTYSNLMAGCTKTKDGYSKAMQLVQELESKGLQMDSVIYGTLLAICASNNLCEEADALFQQMKDGGHSPNLYHYSSLLNAYSVNGNYKKADMLIKDMKASGLEPNKVLMTSLLKVYTRGGLFEKARELLAELDAMGYAENEMPYCLLMDSLAKAGHIEEAEAIFVEMREKKVKSDGYSYSIMISAYCRCRKLKEAKKLAEDFEANYAKYDLVMLNTLLRAYCNAGDTENVMQMMRKFDDLTISPDWNTFHILIKYFCKEKLYHLAYRTVEDMHNRGHQLDEELCSSLILQLGQAGFSSEAFSIYNLLRYRKRTVCQILHEKMVDILVGAGLLKDAYVLVKDNAEQISAKSLKKFAISFMKSGNINLINDVLKALHRSGHNIEPEIFHMAVERYIVNSENKDLLLQLLQWMAGQGYFVDSSSRNLLLKNSHLFGQKQLIAEILSKQHMMSRKLKTSKMKKYS